MTDTVRVYITVDDEPEVGAEDSWDVTPEQAEELVRVGLCYPPEDGDGDLYTYIGKGKATWDHLMGDCEYPNCPQRARRIVNSRKLCSLHASDFEDFLR